MSGAGWEPTHHEEIPDANEPVAGPRAGSTEQGTKPRETKPDTAIPLTLVMSIPPELIAALSSLSGTMERIATEVAAQGKAIQTLAEAMTQRNIPPEVVPE